MSDNVAERQGYLVSTLKEHGASLVGFGDITVLGTELARKYPVAISPIIKYDEQPHAAHDRRCSSPGDAAYDKLFDGERRETIGLTRGLSPLSEVYISPFVLSQSKHEREIKCCISRDL